ncbi:MAG: hypothetical protein A2W11_00725 [Ignavibacteria bacterium RBG_16_35_7]|nr:MAG: hypothetical protein A2W11_00725 [Ignavibacteria bacterium RBG_16_35_7]
MNDVPIKSFQEEATHRELYRRSQDSIRVYNPTDKDYLVDWDGHKHRIPNKNRNDGWGQGMRILPRYIAEKYCREMKNQLINELNEKKLQDIKNKLEKSGATDVLYNANLLMERSHDFRTDNQDLIRKYYEILWLGIEEEFGLDQETKLLSEESQITVPAEEEILKKMANKKYIPETILTNENIDTSGQPSSKYPINKNRKDNLIKEVAI